MSATYVFSDIHGMWDLYQQVKTYLNMGNNKAIFLGDACDRGSNGYKIIKDMLADNNIVYIKGNHEDMFVKAAKVIFNNYKLTSTFISPQDIIYKFCYNDKVNLHLTNSGIDTLEAWIMDGMPMSIINELEALPTLYEVINNEGIKLTFSHAGFREENIGDKQAHVWSRDHFTREWKDGIMIHGHTPVMSSRMLLFTNQNREEAYINPQPQWYANGSKLDIDTACFSTNIIYLVNVDTMEMIKFHQE